MSCERQRFVELVLGNPVNRAILQRAPDLRVTDWWLAGGAVVQTVWNALDGRAATAGIDDYDLFYFDPTDLSWHAEDAVIARGRELFADLDARIEIRNEARVHLWYEQRFGVPAPAFTSSRDAIDHFASTTCCYGISRTDAGDTDVYAPHGYADLFDRQVRPNPALAPAEVYRTKTTRWASEWPSLTIHPWPSQTPTAEH